MVIGVCAALDSSGKVMPAPPASSFISFDSGSTCADNGSFPTSRVEARTGPSPVHFGARRTEARGRATLGRCCPRFPFGAPSSPHYWLPLGVTLPMMQTGRVVGPAAPRVLIVEDDDDSRELITLLVEREGYMVDAAQNGRSALEALAVRRPDLILLDIQMPLLGGKEFAREVRALGIDIPLANQLPEEPRSGGFTTVADGQAMSHFQMERHLGVVDAELTANPPSRGPHPSLRSSERRR